MAKEVMVVTDSDIKEKLWLDKTEIETFRFLAKYAGIEMDEETKQMFIAQRNSKSDSISRLNEFKAWCSKTVDYIDTILKHSFNVGTIENFPANVSVKNNGSTYEFKDGAAPIVIDTLLKKKLVTKEQLINSMTISNVAKATGLKNEKITDMFPDAVIVKKKSATLVIK